MLTMAYTLVKRGRKNNSKGQRGYTGYGRSHDGRRCLKFGLTNLQRKCLAAFIVPCCLPIFAEDDGLEANCLDKSQWHSQAYNFL